MDPNVISRSDWSDIGDFLFGLLFVPGMMILAAIFMLTAHAIIPSLVASGHIPQEFLKLRGPIYTLVLISFLASIAFLVFVAINADNSFGEIWSRWWQ